MSSHATDLAKSSYSSLLLFRFLLVFPRFIHCINVQCLLCCNFPFIINGVWPLWNGRITYLLTDLLYLNANRHNTVRMHCRLGSHSFTDKKPKTFPILSRTPMKNFPGPFRSSRMFKYKEKKRIYLQYSEHTAFQKIQHEAKCGHCM